MTDQKFRLVTRSDFDGLVCAVLLTELGLIDEIAFVHPKDMQDGKIAIGPRDITTNLPYVPGAHLVFDHHDSETIRIQARPDNYVIDATAPSAARVVYRHYGSEAGFPRVSRDMMAAVDKGDSAQFDKDEILSPTGWNLLNFLMDSRTGLGRFRDFRISNYALMMDLIGYCQKYGDDIESILQEPDVKERVDLFFEHDALAKEQLARCTTRRDNCVILDLRQEDTIYAVNRFMIYAMNPAQNVSIHCLWGLKKQNTVFAVGKSIIDRSCNTHVGALMLQYGGGGHHAAGTCQVPNHLAETTLEEIIERLVMGG